MQVYFLQSNPTSCKCNNSCVEAKTAKIMNLEKKHLHSWNPHNKFGHLGKHVYGIKIMHSFYLFIYLFILQLQCHNTFNQKMEQ